MSDSLRWGILGTGWIAELFATDLRALDFELVAVGSRTQAAADEFAGRFDIGTAHASYEDLVADPNVDVIYIATPHPYHAENTLLAIEAGKHVLVEKPFTLNAREAARVAQAAADAGVVVLEAMWSRFLPHMDRIREIIAAGTIGDVRSVIADHNQKLSADPEHRVNNPELGGGALLDLSIYPVSFAVDLLGLPTEIHATATISATGVDEQNALIFEHENGAKSVLHSSLNARGTNRAAVIGTEGWIELDSVWYEPTAFTVFGTDGNVIEKYVSDVPSRGMQYQAWELERVVADGLDESERLPLSQTVAIMAVLDEARRQFGLVYPGE
jgi:predicted dehydrogenase